MRHMIIPAKVLIIYGFVNMTYTLASGESIYGGIDWKSLDSFIAVVVIFFVSLSIFAGIFFV